MSYSSSFNLGSRPPSYLTPECINSAIDNAHPDSHDLLNVALTLKYECWTPVATEKTCLDFIATHGKGALLSEMKSRPIYYDLAATHPTVRKILLGQ